MNKHLHKSTALDQAIEAARALPEAAQDLLAHEIMDCISDLEAPSRSQERQAIIKERLSKPLNTISHDEIMSILRRYDPSVR